MSSLDKDKVLITGIWVKEVNKYWNICKGELRDHKGFWNDTLHSMTNKDWEDMMQVMDYIRATDPHMINDHAAIVFDEVKKVLMYEAHSGNPRALDARKHKHKAFKSLMNIKDIINDITGYNPPTSWPKDEPPSPYETLFSKGL